LKTNYENERIVNAKTKRKLTYEMQSNFTMYRSTHTLKLRSTAGRCTNIGELQISFYGFDAQYATEDEVM